MAWPALAGRAATCRDPAELADTARVNFSVNVSFSFQTKKTRPFSRIIYNNKPVLIRHVIEGAENQMDEVGTMS